jgi:hypothetical protein
MYDKDRILTTNIISLDTMFSSMAASSSMSSFSDLVILTPSEWSGSEYDGKSEHSLVATAAYQNNQSPSGGYGGSVYLSNLCCPLCLATGNKRIFKNTKSLDDHVSSVAHAEKAFRCPMVFVSDKNKASVSVPSRLFTTLSRLTQHLESGQCKGGKSTLWKTHDYLQKDVLQFEWPGRLLKN